MLQKPAFVVSEAEAGDGDGNGEGYARADDETQGAAVKDSGLDQTAEHQAGHVDEIQPEGDFAQPDGRGVLEYLNFGGFGDQGPEDGGRSNATTDWTKAPPMEMVPLRESKGSIHETPTIEPRATTMRDQIPALPHVQRGNRETLIARRAPRPKVSM